MSIGRKWLAPLATLAMASGALGDDVSRPTGMRLQYGDWTFVAVVSMSGATTTVPGVLALRDTSYAVGNNIVSVWYENPGNCTDWAAKAWSSTDQAEAIKWVKAQYGIADGWDFLWPTAGQLTGAPLSETPEDYQKGLLVTDPLFSLTETPQHDAIMTMLTTIGYRAADIPLEQADQSCQLGDLFCGYVDTLVYAIGTPAATEQQVDAHFDAIVPVACQTLATSAPPPPPPPPGWMPPGFPVNPGGPIWVSPPDDPGTYDPTCTVPGVCCYTFQIRRYYWDNDWLGLRWRIFYCETPFSWTCPAPPSGPCPAVPTCLGGPPYFPAPGVTPTCGYRFY